MSLLRFVAGLPITLACVVGMCLALVPSEVESQTRPPEWGKAAADYLDGRQAWWRTWPVAARDHDTACVSCHTALPYALARPALRTALGETGPTMPEVALLADVRTRVMLWNEVDPYYPDQTSGLPKSSESRGTEAILNALILASHDAQNGRLTSETRQAFENLWGLQFTRGEGAGAWAWLNFNLAPWESDGAAYFGAALAAVAVGVAPNNYASSTEVQEELVLLRAYLQQGSESRPPLDQVMLLWASSELSGLLTQDQSQSIISDVMLLQNSDGGWSLTSLRPWERQDGLTRFTKGRCLAHSGKPEWGPRLVGGEPGANEWPVACLLTQQRERSSLRQGTLHGRRSHSVRRAGADAGRFVE